RVKLVPDHPAELLVGDTSEADLQPVTIVGPDEAGPGCAVPNSGKCSAIRAGRSMVYPDSEELDACPYLRDRAHGEGCSAVCVPVNVLGRSVGVLHAASDIGAPFEESQVHGLETIARVTGARITMVRALAENEGEAGTDSLTGLMNRRQLEDRVRLLIRGEVDFSIAMADLDHFEQLNETHGQETGDQALRVFSEVCQETLRPDDLICRYGGEEFVVVFPRTSTTDAAKALGRLRAALDERLDGAEVPEFTSSFGVAGSPDGETLDEMLLVADRALYRAKEAGRNGIVIAGASVEPVDDYDDILG
ncbi:MAG: sensor domain-containing diguanylate cyclase, partial [Actinomycetota bacterium]|nr:sensor domain-containing diguanylate cyclase [Actinomycetota bacterium]